MPENSSVWRSDMVKRPALPSGGASRPGTSMPWTGRAGSLRSTTADGADVARHPTPHRRRRQREGQHRGVRIVARQAEGHRLAYRGALRGKDVAPDHAVESPAAGRVVHRIARRVQVRGVGVGHGDEVVGLVAKGGHAGGDGGIRRATGHGDDCADIRGRQRLAAAGAQPGVTDVDVIAQRALVASGERDHADDRGGGHRQIGIGVDRGGDRRGRRRDGLGAGHGDRD